MMENIRVKNGVVIGIIFLFVGVAIAPGINQNIITASQDNDLVEVTTQACGIPGYKDTTVKLTREQYQDLERYLVEFRAKLNQTATRTEAVQIFQDAVMKLNKYGLLPKGMRVEQAQQIMTRGDHLLHMVNSMKKPMSASINSFCLFTAITYDVIDYNIWVLIAAVLSTFIQYDSPLIFLVYLFFFIGFVKPLRLLNILVVPENLAAVKFYFTFGLRGINTGLNEISSVVGFSGLKIWLNSHNAFYLGFALAVNR